MNNNNILTLRPLSVPPIYRRWNGFILFYYFSSLRTFYMSMFTMTIGTDTDPLSFLLSFYTSVVQDVFSSLLGLNDEHIIQFLILRF